MSTERKSFRKCIKALIPVCMLFGMMSIVVKAVWADSVYYGKELATGICGAEGNENGVVWTVYDSGADGDESTDTADTIVFSGSGEMADFENASRPWYTYISGLTTVMFTEDSQITSIGDMAFINCEKLKSVVLPESVTEIGVSAFSYCKGLNEVTFSKSLKTIGNSAFWSCSSLTNVEIWENVEIIGTQAFGYCHQLKIEVADANQNYSSLDGVLYNKDKTKIIFYITATEDIVIPESVTTIEEWAFANNSTLTSICMENVTNIGFCGFYNCKNLVDITLSKNLTTIGNWVFKDCTSLTSISIPENVTSIASNTFENCSSMKAFYYPDTLEDKIANVTIPQTAVLGTYTVKEDNTISLTITYIPEGTTDILVPETISGKYISSLEYDEEIGDMDIKVTCKKHYPKDGQVGKDANSHWFSECKICGETSEFEEEHQFGNGTRPCKCGYIPFTISKQPESIELIFGEKKELNVSVTPAYEELEITYQWYEDETEILGAVESTYAIPSEKKTAEYSYYCKITCGEYSIVSDSIIVTVVKADTPLYMPATSMAVENTIKKVSEVTLPKEWQWDSEDIEKTLPAGQELKVTANYVGDDKEYYNCVSMVITIQRAACQSSDVLYTGEGEKAPTCTKDGKGHKECTDCGDILECDIIVPALNLEHTGGMATCTEKAVCEHCGEEYGELDKTNHIETEVRDRKEATATEKGYTGDVYCKDCGEMLSRGEEIPALVVTESPTVTPTVIPSQSASATPTVTPSESPSVTPSESPSVTPSESPSAIPSESPSATPSESPSITPSESPSITPSESPSITPSKSPSATPGESPSITPSESPSITPSESPSATPTVTPSESPSATPTVTPSESPSATPSESPSITPSKSPSATPTVTPTQKPTSTIKAPKKGTILTDKKGKAKYKVVASGTKSGTVEYVKTTNKKTKKITIPAKVTINGITYKVVSVGKNALKNNKKVTKVTIGSNVKKIGKQAFYGCKNLKTITIKSKKLTNKMIGSKAFKGINSKATIKVPKGKVKAYKKILKAKGIGTKVKVKK